MRISGRPLKKLKRPFDPREKPFCEILKNQEETMALEEKKGFTENLIDKFRSIFSPQDPQQKKNALLPKAHFSIWYFLVVFSPGKTYSEEKAAQIDEEVARLVDETHQRVHGILSSQRKVLEQLAGLVFKEEMVQGDELRRMLGKSPREPQTA
jgi:hypothetical protein